ncbi:hypothetical protein H072_5003 [Dactylellina haptotyla CBS 200.50]|uniref:TNFR-Cys domain-containing protein n=1 Tax=Dactylellina haptotyla (strain CBS 200.50) TaxID=1284197 RepID=S8ADN6_DACHA|nr:hypothetical protein H072_5003 [Dactylellina haptotyla CBS 200.50]
MLLKYSLVVAFAILLGGSEAASCSVLPASCTPVNAASSASCVSLFSSSKIKRSTCTSTSTVTLATVTKTVTSISGTTTTTSVTDTRTIEQTKKRSSTSITLTSLTTATEIATTTLEPVITTVFYKRWMHELFARAPVVPADCSCFLTSTSTKTTTLKTPTTTSVVVVPTTKTYVSTIKTTITISNVGTTLTFTETFVATYSSTETIQSTVTVSQPACPSPSMTCGGSCIDPRTDPTNCGGCGSQCDDGMACNNGVCVVGACASRQQCSERINCFGTGDSSVLSCACNYVVDGPPTCVNQPPNCLGEQSCTASSQCPLGWVCVATCCTNGNCRKGAVKDNCPFPVGPLRFMARREVIPGWNENDLPPK